MDYQTDHDHQLVSEYDEWHDADKDLFGEALKPDPPGLASGKVETFDLDGGLSHSERLLIGAEMTDRIETELIPKRADRMMAEIERFTMCGIQAMQLQCRDCHCRYYIRNSCRSRVCPECSRVYYKKLKKQILPVLRRTTAKRRRGYVLGLLTLTVTSKRFGDDLPTRDAIKRLYGETSKFLRLLYGKYAGRLSKSGKVVENRKRWIGAGWFAVLEFGSDNNNAHCHIVTYGPIRQWHKLVTAWEGITKDSRGVDIRAIRKLAVAVEYVLKYIAKPPQTDSYKRIAEYAWAVKGTRRLRSGGVFYNRFTIERPEGLPFHCAVCCGKLVPDGNIDLTREPEIPSLYDSLRAVLN